jgi:hypothetical protein
VAVQDTAASISNENPEAVLGTAIDFIRAPVQPSAVDQPLAFEVHIDRLPFGRGHAPPAMKASQEDRTKI